MKHDLNGSDIYAIKTNRLRVRDGLLIGAGMWLVLAIPSTLIYWVTT